MVASQIPISRYAISFVVKERKFEGRGLYHSHSVPFFREINISLTFLSWVPLESCWKGPGYVTALTERNSGKGKMELPSRLGLSMMCSLHLTRVVSKRMVLSAKKGEVDSHSTSVCHDKSVCKAWYHWGEKKIHYHLRIGNRNFHKLKFSLSCGRN